LNVFKTTEPAMNASTGTTTLARRRAATQLGSPVAAMPYRTADAPWVQERSLLLAERAEQLAKLPPAFASLYAKRWARVNAGIVMLLGAIALGGAGIAHLIPRPGESWTPPYSMVLLAALGLSTAIYVVTRALTRPALAQTVRESALPTDDAHADVRRLAGRTAAGDAADLVAALERRSLAWPLIGFSLLSPLAIHFVLALLFSVPIEGFDTWVAISLALTVPAHVTLAAFGAQLAREISATGPDGPHGVSVGRHALRAWGITVLVSLVPGIVLLAIPPIIVGLTGVFIPILFTTVARIASEERVELALARDVARR
jgi:hypothetical protein